MEKIREGDIPGVQLRCRKTLGLAPDAASRWLVEPPLMSRWLADTVTLSGDTFEILSKDAAGEIRLERARIVEQRPQHWLFGFTVDRPQWQAETPLEIELFARPSGCEVSVLQRGFQRLPLSLCLTFWEEYRRRWRQALERLARECL